MLHVLRPVYISYIHTSVAKTLVCFSNTNSCVFPIRTLGILFLSLSCLIYCRLGLTHFVAVWNRICSELNFLPFFKTCFFFSLELWSIGIVSVLWVWCVEALEKVNFSFLSRDIFFQPTPGTPIIRDFENLLLPGRIWPVKWFPFICISNIFFFVGLIYYLFGLRDCRVVGIVIVVLQNT
jgi:hypothetical protein